MTVAMQKTDSTSLTQLITKGRESDEQRIARFGWSPFVQCIWCGDTGIDPEFGTECHCVVGVAKNQQRIRREQWPTLVPKRFVDYTLTEHPNKRLAADVGAWLDSNPIRTGENLVIQGATGRGKTGAAIGALRELHFQGALVRYWSLPDLMDQLRAEEFGRGDTESAKSRPTMAWLTNCACLLLDDMGTERPTKYVEDRLYTLFDGRYVDKRPTVITTNYSKDKLREYWGERITSRIEESVRYVGAPGLDLRKTRSKIS